MIKLLVERRADLEGKGLSGCTALLLSSFYGNVENCEYLLQAGADINATNNDKHNVLHMAASQGRMATVQYFVQLGVDVNSKDAVGNTPFDLAEKHPEVQAFLKPLMADK
eukprot:c4053_g1_i4.p1 GENE.c4053_g1_i4~~c4053_g1_i4.p1  ORF type:complete len:110 (-),score=25.79 c4053_g1_i4:106-435(-)